MSFIDSSHFIYWLKSFYLLAQVILFMDFTHVIYWLESFYLLTRVILFIGLSHFIFGAALRIRNGSPLAYDAIYSCAWGKLFRHSSYRVRCASDICMCYWAKIGCVAKHNTTTTALWISQQLMLQSRIGQKEMILWDIIYYRRMALKKLNWFYIAGCEMIVMGWGGVLATRCRGPTAFGNW